MNSSTQEEIDLSAVLNLVPYLDVQFPTPEPGEQFTLNWLIDNINENKEMYVNQGLDEKTFATLEAAVASNSDYGSVKIIDQSNYDGDATWTNDPFQACTFESHGDYYVAYRGTGGGRWSDDGEGLGQESTSMQRAASDYFDKISSEYDFAGQKDHGSRIVVTGHSKGGNEAQYTFMAAEDAYLIDDCYSFDGQGFSGSAIDMFKDIHGDEYEDRLSHMYSINGENDFVHDLGFVIIPGENTYFTPSVEDGFGSYHDLNYLIGDGKGSYSGLVWQYDENGNLSHGKQGILGEVAKEISASLMRLDEDDLRGCAVAVMWIIEQTNIGSNGEKNYGVSPTVFDFLDFLTYAPDVISDAGMSYLAKQFVKTMYDRFGAPGLVAAVVVTGVVKIKHLVHELTTIHPLKIIDAVMDGVRDIIEKVKNVSEKIKNCINEIKSAISSAVKKIIAKLKSKTVGYKYATNHPVICLDTAKLRDYAQRLSKLNSRIVALDLMMDSLYGKVGLLDLWNLMQADILTGYSWRLNRCADYLLDTAEDFEDAEDAIATYFG